MSAECRKCGRDLDGDFKCGSCDCAKKLSDVGAENKKLKTVLEIRHNEVLDAAENEWLLGKKIDELRAEIKQSDVTIETLTTATQRWAKENEQLKLLNERHAAKLAEAYQYLKQGKAKFTPSTTNSFVDDWLKWYEANVALEEK